jgi:two-component system response regulator FlrC
MISRTDPFATCSSSPADSVPGVNGPSANAQVAPMKSLADLEREQIIIALKHTDGNRKKASDILGITYRTLRNKIKEYQQSGIDVPPPH